MTNTNNERLTYSQYSDLRREHSNYLRMKENAGMRTGQALMNVLYTKYRTVYTSMLIDAGAPGDIWDRDDDLSDVWGWILQTQ